MALSENLKFDDKGLLTAIAQDADSGEVLMVAFMNQEALEKTLETGEAHYWSRSRQELWHKGGTSGHTQKVDRISIDCDGDAVLMRVRQQGAACHKGYRSCFYRDIGADGTLSVVEDKTFDPEKVYGSK